MYARDSLINIRHTLKRPHPSSPSYSDSDSSSSNNNNNPIPIDDLRARVAAKRQRCVTGSGSGGAVASAVTNHTGKKTVRFDVGQNVVHTITANAEDLKNAWMSEEETELIRRKNLHTIAMFRAGKMDTTNDTLRGLELHATEDLIQMKIENGRNFNKAILQQQQFLRSMMGRANDLILGRMSSILSTEDMNDAIHTASIDAQEAAYIHGTSTNSMGTATPKSLNVMESNKPTPAATNPTVAACFQHDSLVRLLACSK